MQAGTGVKVVPSMYVAPLESGSQALVGHQTLVMSPPGSDSTGIVQLSRMRYALQAWTVLYAELVPVPEASLVRHYPPQPAIKGMSGRLVRGGP